MCINFLFLWHFYIAITPLITLTFAPKSIKQSGVSVLHKRIVIANSSIDDLMFHLYSQRIIVYLNKFIVYFMFSAFFLIKLLLQQTNAIDVRFS